MGLATHPYSCDVCGIQREKDTNRWFLLRFGKNEADKARVVIDEWDGEMAKEPGIKHVCGVTHAVSLVERIITTGEAEQGIGRIRKHEDSRN